MAGHRSSRSSTAELKCLDVPTTILPGAAGALTIGTNALLLNGTINGAAFSQRIGARLKMRSIQLQILFTENPSTLTATTVQFLRLMLVYDSATNGALMGFNDLLQQTDFNNVDTNNFDSFYNMNNRDRFLVLWDKRVLFNRRVVANPVGAVAAGQDVNLTTAPSAVYKKYVKLRNLETVYKNPSVATVAGIATGALVFLAISNLGVVGFVNVQVTARMRFYD